MFCRDGGFSVSFFLIQCEWNGTRIYGISFPVFQFNPNIYLSAVFSPRDTLDCRFIKCITITVNFTIHAIIGGDSESKYSHVRIETNNLHKGEIRSIYG